MSDLISRQDTIDALRNQMSDWNDDYNVPVRKSIENIERLPSAQPYTNEEIQKMQDMEQAEFQKAFELGKASAEAEIIRCKDCKYCIPDEMFHTHWCRGKRVLLDHYCGYAERKENE